MWTNRSDKAESKLSTWISVFILCQWNISRGYWVKKTQSMETIEDA